MSSPSLFPHVKLTPTQDLIISVLVARVRLGESLWTFDSKVAKQLKQLEDAGIVDVMSGVVENTVRASFTNCGFAEYCSYDYIPPIVKNIDDDELRNKFLKISETARDFKQQFLDED